MTRFNFSTLLILAALLQAGLTYAQQRQLSTTSARAEKAWYKATDCLNLRDYNCAERELRRAVDTDPGFSEAWIVLGETLADNGRYEEALSAFRDGLNKGRTYYTEVLYYIGNLSFRTGQYEEARQNLEAFLDSRPKSERRIQQAEKLLSSCRFAIEAIMNPRPFEPKNLGPAVNSAYSEYFPCLTLDDQTLLFTRRITDESNPAREQEDFFISRRQNGEWGAAVNIGYPINTRNNEGAPTLSPDGSFLIFTACSSQTGYGEGREGYGSCDLFISRKLGDKWGTPVNLGAPVNTSKWETQPSFSGDGRTLYFIRGFHDRQGYYHQDIYTSELHPDGSWGEPKRLPDHINSPGIEESVFIHPDGQTLYFSSDGWIGMGGLDIYMSRKLPDGNWSLPENLGYPINTHDDENSLMVSGDGRLGYFASDRPGGFGKLDLYSFEIPEPFRPQQITYLKGTVFDEVTKKKLGARFELVALKNGETITSAQSDPVDGTFLVALPTGQRYALSVSHPDYLFYSDHFDLQGHHGYDRPFVKDVPLQPIQLGETVVLKNVFFATDSYALKPESQIELDRLALLLEQNPAISIEIGGHTDSQGNDSYNLELSLNRARAVYDYLTQKNIQPSRLAYKGYGEAQPIDTNETDEGRAVNRRTEFKIVNL